MNFIVLFKEDKELCVVDETDIMFDKNLKRGDWECMSLYEFVCMSLPRLKVIRLIC